MNYPDHLVSIKQNTGRMYMANKIEYMIFDGHTIESVAEYCEKLSIRGWETIQLVSFPVPASKLRGMTVKPPNYDPNAIVLMYAPFCRKSE